MKKNIAKIFSLLLALTLVFTSTSVAFAQDEIQSDYSTDEPFRISTTINGDPSTRRGICWYTSAYCESLIKVFGDNEENIKIELDNVFEWEGYFCHKATVSNLTPGEKYSYEISDGKNVKTGSFVTDDKEESVKFLAIADVQAGNIDNMKKGANTLLAGLSILPDADFVANLGDFTNDSNNEEWNYYDEAFADINKDITLAPVAGNHDGFARANWFNYFFNLDTSESVQTKSGVNYSFDYGNAHFAVLNTNDVLSISLSQLNWLKNDMNSTDKDWKIVLMHKAPYTLGKDGKWPDALYLQRSLTAVCDMCDVDIVMYGHDHQYLRTKKLKANMVNDDGTVYVLAGTAGSKRYEVRSFLAGLFTDTNIIAALNIQKNGYGNYWNGENWDNTKETNVGGCFNTIEIEGGNLVFNSYILSDSIMADPDKGELAYKDGRLITKADSFTLTKETGLNKSTYSGDNSTSEAAFSLGVVPSFLCLATYTFVEWLPKFLINIPNLAYVYITEDTF